MKHLRTPPWSLLAILGLLLLSMGCAAESSDGDGGNDGDNNGSNNQTEPEPAALDLNRCQSGGGRFSDTQCNKLWDCNNTDFFEEEVSLFEVICSDNTCRCEISGEELAVFTFEDPTEYCGVFSEPEFAQRVMEKCNFPDGPSSDGGDDNNGDDNNGGGNNGQNNAQAPPARQGFAAAPSSTCQEEMYRLTAQYYGEVASASLLAAWTDSPLDDPGQLFIWGEIHPVDLTDSSTPAQPSTDLSLSLQANFNYRPGTVSVIDCAGWDAQTTMVLRLEDAQEQPIACAIWGHDKDGLLNDQYEFGLSITNEDAQTLLEGCPFEEF